MLPNSPRSKKDERHNRTSVVFWKYLAYLNIDVVRLRLTNEGPPETEQSSVSKLRSDSSICQRLANCQVVLGERLSLQLERGSRFAFFWRVSADHSTRVLLTGVRRAFGAVGSRHR